jgi:hypothetical protein
MLAARQYNTPVAAHQRHARTIDLNHAMAISHIPARDGYIAYMTCRGCTFNRGHSHASHVDRQKSGSTRDARSALHSLDLMDVTLYLCYGTRCIHHTSRYRTQGPDNRRGPTNGITTSFHIGASKADQIEVEIETIAEKGDDAKCARTGGPRIQSEEPSCQSKGYRWSAEIATLDGDSLHC